MADNISIPDISGASKTLATKDVSTVQHLKFVATDSAGVDATDTSNNSVKVTLAAVSATASSVRQDDTAYTVGTHYLSVAGGVATSDLVDANDQGAFGMTKARQQYVVPYLTPINASTTVTGTSSTALTNFGAASGLKNYITDISFHNSSATTTFIKLQDGNGGATFAYLSLPAGGGNSRSFTTPLVQPTANTALYFAANDSATTLYITVTGYQAP